MNNDRTDNPDEQEKKDRTMDTLINTVEKHTRTTRHLEQYSDIGNPEYKDLAREKQDLREKQITELKEQIIDPKPDTLSKNDHLQNLKETYESSEGYIKNNQDHMDSNMLKDLQNKQENRKSEIENLENN